MSSDGSTSPEDESPADRVDPESDFPALTVTLEEARERYHDEERRQNSIESKTSMLSGINVLIITLTTAFFRQDLSYDNYHTSSPCLCISWPSDTTN